MASQPYWLVCGLFWFVLFKTWSWQGCVDVLFHNHQGRQCASPMLSMGKWMGKKTRAENFDRPQSVMCHQQPSLWVSVTMCLKELSGCRLIDHLKGPQASELRREDPQSRKKTVLRTDGISASHLVFLQGLDIQVATQHYTMKVSGVQCLFQNSLISTVLTVFTFFRIYCFVFYKFGMTWRWVNNDNNYISLLNYSFKWMQDKGVIISAGDEWLCGNFCYTLGFVELRCVIDRLGISTVFFRNTWMLSVPYLPGVS